MGERSHVDARLRPELGLPERYEPVRHIATGGMASVWCAHDVALGRKVAIKLLAERFADDPAAADRFMREARAAARLSGHPNVVMIYDVGETEPEPDQRPFIVMEYLAGGSVADALRVDSVRRVNAVKWIREAASALDYGHSRGVLHRDIKPANLLLDRDRVLHVADFGIARLGTEDTITGTGQVIGTASYLAPERALGRPATDASDRYSLAVAAYELLVGERPFASTHFAAQARQHVEDTPPAASRRNRTLPRAVDAVLARGMAKRPEQRWPSAQEFAEALEAALSEPVTRALRAAPVAAAAPRSARPAAPRPARPPAPRPAASADGDPRRPRRSSRRARVPALAALAAGAAVAVAVAGTLGSGPSPQVRASAARSQPSRTVHTVRRATTRAPKPAPKPHTVSTVTATPAAATTPAPVADTLEARGHQLMQAGDYPAAIPTLRQAVAAAPAGSLTYAYALFDLGRSLRLAGDPKAAVSVLYQRLQIPNQTDVVRHELQLALLALGQKAQSGGAGAAPAGPGGAARDHGRRGHHFRTEGAAGGPSLGGAGAVAPPPTQGD